MKPWCALKSIRHIKKEKKTLKKYYQLPRMNFKFMLTVNICHLIFCFAFSVFQVSKYIGSLYMKIRIEHTQYFHDFIHYMCQAVCVLFISVDHMVF